MSDKQVVLSVKPPTSKAPRDGNVLKGAVSIYDVMKDAGKGNPKDQKIKEALR